MITTINEFRNFFESMHKFIVYHNTTEGHKNKIMQNGFQIVPNIRGNLYGNGIYFSFKPNKRWGDFTIKCEVKCNNTLIDYNDDLIYEDTDLGKSIIQFGEQYLQNWIPGTTFEHNKDLWKEALNQFIKYNKYDSLITYEYGNQILVVFDPKIITILNNDYNN